MTGSRALKTLLVLRHAKSSWARAGLADHDRPLNPRGKADAPRMGQLLLDRGLVPELILCSTAKRARKTAEKVAESCEYRQPLQSVADLYLAGPPSCYEALRDVADGHQRVLVVGHNPGMEDLILELVGQYHRMPTAALAHIELEIESWSNLSSAVKGTLLHLWRPKELESSL